MVTRRTVRMHPYLSAASEWGLSPISNDRTLQESKGVFLMSAGLRHAGEGGAMRPTMWPWLLLVACVTAVADDSVPVFRSDVAMGRIDTLVMDRSQHPIGGLRKE